MVNAKLFSDLAFQINDEERKLGHQTAAVARRSHSVTVVRLTIHMVSHGFWFNVFNGLKSSRTQLFS